MKKKTQKRGRGRPAHAPTPKDRKQVELMAAFGNTEDQISMITGITKPTLIKHYARELEFGFLKANNAVAQNLFRQATKDDVRSVNAAMFWLKMRAGWKEYMLPQAPRDQKLGKKEQDAVNAATPDPAGDMGKLMLLRQEGPPN